LPIGARKRLIYQLGFNLSCWFAGRQAINIRWIPTDIISLIYSDNSIYYQLALEQPLSGSAFRKSDDSPGRFIVFETPLAFLKQQTLTC
jgi:hypothetical protein